MDNSGWKFQGKQTRNPSHSFLLIHPGIAIHFDVYVWTGLLTMQLQPI